MGNPFVSNAIFPYPGLPDAVRNFGVFGARNSLAPVAGVHYTTVDLVDGAAGPYDFSNTANRALNVFFSEDNGASYRKVSYTALVGATPATTTAAELAVILNANSVFSSRFLAANNAGALRITQLQPSSRFKTYFTGTAGAVLGGDFAVAIAPGTAITAANQVGVPVEYVVESASGELISGIDVYATTSLSGKIVLVEAGTIQSGALGSNSLVIRTGEDGRVKFYAVDAVAEVSVATISVGSGGANISQVANVMKNTVNVTFA